MIGRSVGGISGGSSSSSLMSPVLTTAGQLDKPTSGRFTSQSSSNNGGQYHSPNPPPHTTSTSNPILSGYNPNPSPNPLVSVSGYSSGGSSLDSGIPPHPSSPMSGVPVTITPGGYSQQHTPKDTAAAQHILNNNNNNMASQQQQQQLNNPHLNTQHHHPNGIGSGTPGNPSSSSSLPPTSSAITTSAAGPPPLSSSGPGPGVVGPAAGVPVKQCAACGGKILERFLLHAMERYWHTSCLKCSCCQAQLGEIGTTCFTKGGMILCKNDYLR